MKITKNKWYKYIPIRIFLNITYTKLVATYIIYVGIETNNMTLVGWGVATLVGRKFGSAFINNSVSE